MLSNNVLNLLNKKINEDYFRSNLFLDIAGWAGDLSLAGGQGYFQNLSAKSLDSVNATIEYLNQSGHEVSLGAINEGLRDFDNVLDLFVYIKELEVGYQAEINNLLDVCLSEKDFATFATFEGLAKNQHQEQFFLQTSLDKLNILGYKGQGLYIFDKDLAAQYPVQELTAPF